VERTRGLQLETDANYQNDTIGGANALTLTQAGTHQTATVAGTLMPGSSPVDVDVFNLGVFNAGNVVELSTRLPGTSTLVPKVTLLDAAGAVIADTDGNSSDGHVLATLAGDGAVYAKVEPAVWEHGGHRYVVTENAMTWADAEAYAQTLGGHLVTVDDAAEQAWLTAQFGGFNPWIGYTDQAVEGTWVWASGSGSSYQNWGSNESNQSDSRLDAAYMSSDGRWHAYYNEPWANYYHGLIELDSASGSTDKGPGPQAQYLLDVDIADQVAPRVVSVTGLPANGATAALPVGPSITVTLSEALAAATVSAGSGGALSNWSLRRAGADGVFDTADDGQYRLVLAEAYTSGTTVKLRIEGSEAGQAVSLGEGQYRLTASAALTDGVGNALDGNGDGTGGDGFVRTFTIALPAGRTFEGENNNTLGQATALALAEDPAGSGLALGYGLGRQDPAVIPAALERPGLLADRAAGGGRGQRERGHAGQWCGPLCGAAQRGGPVCGGRQRRRPGCGRLHQPLRGDGERELLHPGGQGHLRLRSRATTRCGWSGRGASSWRRMRTTRTIPSAAPMR
jgi:hypothetical protein